MVLLQAASTFLLSRRLQQSCGGFASASPVPAPSLSLWWQQHALSLAPAARAVAAAAACRACCEMFVALEPLLRCGD